MTSDHDNWLQCHTCGTLVAKVHAKRQDEIVGIREPDHSIHDHDKAVIKSVMQESILAVKRRQFIKYLNRINHRTKIPEDKDPDLQNMLNQGKQLISYQGEQN